MPSVSYLLRYPLKGKPRPSIQHFIYFDFKYCSAQCVTNYQEGLGRLGQRIRLLAVIIDPF